MDSLESIAFNPIGIVHCSNSDDKNRLRYGQDARIDIYPQYAKGLLRMEEHSHFWILCWFNHANQSLRVRPCGGNPNNPLYGVFGVRSPSRPNNISLTLVKLEKLEGNSLFVQGMDAFDGTPVLDIKPYFEQDVIFSPFTPYIRIDNREMRKLNILGNARRHHGEDCSMLAAGVRMGLIAEEEFGNLTASELHLKVSGSPCLADVLQGITKARFANPQRLMYFSNQDTDKNICCWENGDKQLNIEVKKDIPKNFNEIMKLKDEELFIIGR